MHLFFRPLGSADSAENISIFFLPLCLFKSEIVDFPKPSSWETPTIDISWYIILPFCHFAAIPPKKKRKEKNCVDYLYPLQCPFDVRLIRLSDVQISEVLLSYNLECHSLR